MSEEERLRWDERYASGDYRPRTEPSAFLEAALDVVPPGRALVLACGTGRNAIRLAEAGFDVEAIDISRVAIEIAAAEAERRALSVAWKVADLEDFVPDPDAYALVTTVRYVNRSMWPAVADALASHGWLLMEQHLRTRLDVVGPGPDFRVEPGELLEAFSDLRVVEYREGLEPGDRPEGTAALARLLACRGDPGW